MAVSRKDVAFRSREFVFTPIDTAAYSDLLADAFPDFRYFNAPPPAPEGPSPPEIVVWPTLKACHRFKTVRVVSDPHWTPKWERDERYGWWILKERPFPYAQIFCYCPIYRGEKLASELPPEDRKSKR